MIIKLDVDTYHDEGGKPRTKNEVKAYKPYGGAPIQVPEQAPQQSVPQNSAPVNQPANNAPIQGQQTAPVNNAAPSTGGAAPWNRK